MKISFDFDSTLGEVRLQKVAEKFINWGHEVFITTSRLDEMKGRPDWNWEVFSVAQRLGIPKENIRMTNGKDKWEFLAGFDIHFDDDLIEIELIEENMPSCAAILISDESYTPPPMSTK